jgi:hypothetical protein
MKTVLVLGIGDYNYNHRKITGWLKAFKEKYHVKHVDRDNLGEIQRVIDGGDIDIVFGESHHFLQINFSKIPVCVIWQNYDIEKVLDLSGKYPNTKFILACKSIMHNVAINEDYIKKHGSDYQIDMSEGQNLIKFQGVIEKSQIIDNNTFKITDNLFYIYLPYCLSEAGALQNVEYDICYFGSLHNRPRTINILNELKDKGYRVVSNLYQGHLSPDDCFNLYSKTICTISEQVAPIQMEYPVRLGESTANGCLFFLYDDLLNSRHQSPLIPFYKNYNEITDISNYIDEIKNNNSKRNNLFNNFTQTYQAGLLYLEGLLN